MPLRSTSPNTSPDCAPMDKRMPISCALSLTEHDITPNTPTDASTSAITPKTAIITAT